MKTPKKSLAALLAMTLTVGLTACSGETDSQSAQSASSQPAQSASSSHTQEESGFPFTLTTKDGQEVTFTPVSYTHLLQQGQCGAAQPAACRPVHVLRHLLLCLPRQAASDPLHCPGEDHDEEWR